MVFYDYKYHIKSKECENSIMEKGKDLQQNKRILKLYVCSMIILSIVIIGFISYNAHNHTNYLTLSLYFIKVFNIVISILGVFSCLKLYQRNKDSDVFLITLMFIGLATSICFKHIDYFIFYQSNIGLSDYIVVSASLLRVSVLILTITNKNKLKDIIIKNKFQWLPMSPK